MNGDFSLSLKSALRQRSAMWITTGLDFHYTGIVVGLSDDWCVVEVIDESFRLNGFESFRIGELSNVRAGVQAAFVAAVLDARHEAPSATCPVSVEGIGRLLESASAKFPILVVHKDLSDPVALCFGTILGVEGGIVWMREMDDNAFWQSQPTSHKLADITQVSFGGGHEDALALVGGPPPSAIVSLRPDKNTT